MNRIVVYLALIIAVLDLICFSLFMALPTLELESSASNKLGSVVIAVGPILSVISVLVVCMLFNPTNANANPSTPFGVIQRFSSVILIAFAIFVVLYLVNVFRKGI
jgi:hypothetical protein